MASQQAHHQSVKDAVLLEDVTDNATDSGYGGSIAGESSSLPSDNNIFDKSFSEEVTKCLHQHHHLPSARQQELYKENCQLLTSSIEETKHVLKVRFLFVHVTDLSRL